MGKRTETFVLDCTARLVKILDTFTPFNVFREKLPVIPKNDFWIDGYVLVFWATSIASYILSFVVYRMCAGVMIATYSVFAVLAIWRIYEIVVYQLRVLFVDHYLAGPTYKLRSYRRSLVLSGCNYIETIFWFAVLYSVIAHLGWIKVPAPAGLSILRESVGLMVANATGKFELDASFAVRHLLAWLTVTAHASIGLFMSLVIVARFVSLLPKPGTEDEKEPPS